MHDDQWKDTRAMVRQKFKVLDEGREEIEDIPGAFVEFIEFETPQGKMRLERTTKPAVLDKKTVYSKTAGRASQIEYTYSPDEIVHRLEAFRFNEQKGDWEEMRAPAL